MSAPRPTSPVAARTQVEGRVESRVDSMAFGDLVIRFDARVLRPRPWTVAQSAWAAELLPGAPSGPVLELCAGVGQIGLQAVCGQHRELVCVDLSPVACAFARENAEIAGLEQRVDVRQGPMEEVVTPADAFGLVIADPPWVRNDAITTFPEDPALAIDGGYDGLEVARTCLRVASDHLLPGGSVVLQLGDEEQATALADELPSFGDLELIELRAFPRGVLVRLDLP